MATVIEDDVQNTDEIEVVLEDIYKGDKGDKGDTGAGVASGGTTGQVLAKKSNTDYDTEWVDAGSGGAGSWSELSGKPFSTIGTGLTVENNALKVNVVDVAQEDNTLPITSNAVAVSVGNINALLALI